MAISAAPVPPARIEGSKKKVLMICVLQGGRREGGGICNLIPGLHMQRIYATSYTSLTVFQKKCVSVWKLTDTLSTGRLWQTSSVTSYWREE